MKIRSFFPATLVDRFGFSSSLQRAIASSIPFIGTCAPGVSFSQWTQLVIYRCCCLARRSCRFGPLDRVVPSEKRRFHPDPKRRSRASPVEPPRARHPRPTETNQAVASSAWPRRTARHPWFRSNPSMSAYFNTDLPLPP